ncbi:hypothetical protein PPEP_a3962 [Pseudoalteromonas peptidolytica F12-50-A1]|uniref:Uncharacterized protein n=1 Tax=Pseudoalteromonas peptidolytica F12-50-A1 TaxID=1315280 RepID=A0A8I0MW53_9GAMM|nr:hypothetical protein [Pseudoalteromonas peptidolytica F12-50-A1]
MESPITHIGTLLDGNVMSLPQYRVLSKANGVTFERILLCV